MNPGRRGRPAILPAARYAPPPRLVIDDAACTVHFFQEDGGVAIPFEFGAWPVHQDLQRALAAAFERVTGPSGTLRARHSAQGAYYVLQRFVRFCAATPHPPQRAVDLTPAHLNRYVLEHQRKTLGTRSRDLSRLRTVLRAVDGLSPALRAALERVRLPQRVDGELRSYTRAEEQRIIQAARRDLRAAATRIRENVDLLERWRAGAIDAQREPSQWERGYLLDVVATTGDVPRTPGDRPLRTNMVRRHSDVSALMSALYLTALEATAATILLITSTGLNGGTLARTPAMHHRADSGSDTEVGVALVNVDKPRRGRTGRYLTFPLVDLPAWCGIQQAGDVVIAEQDELATPFAIFVLLLELTATARSVCNSPDLLLWAGRLKGYGNVSDSGSSTHIHAGLQFAAMTKWGKHAGLYADPIHGHDEQVPLDASMLRLRLTYVQRAQRPVAHTQRTLADIYLLRDQGSVTEYQRLVAQAQEEQVQQARAAMRLQVLSANDLAQVARDAAQVARRFGITVDVLRRLVAGQLTTVLAACVDMDHSPFSPPGTPCTASFLLCLSCPCARVTPQHLPLLLLTRDTLLQLRDITPPLAWTQRFAGPCAQLDEVINRFSPDAIAAACAAISDSDRQLVQRLLQRELDVPS